MAKAWKRPKDPEDIADYGIDFVGTEDAPGLAFGNPVSSANYTVVSGSVAIAQQSLVDNSVAVVRTTGGALGETCELRCHIVCDDGQEFDQTAKLKIKER